MMRSHLARWTGRLLALPLLALLLSSASTAAPTRPSSQLSATFVLNGTPTYLGAVVATTTKNNHDTAVAFNNTGNALKAKVLLIQCDADAYFLPGTANTAAVTTANGIKLSADERVIVMMHPDYGWIAFLAIGASATCDAWELI